MINIVSWNIQCGRGLDGQIDLARIASDIKSFGDIDIICLQEVARHDPELDDGKAEDQKAILSTFFAHYEVFFGPALNRRYEGDQHRRQFGNMVLSRLPVLQVFNHLLPQPAPLEPCKYMLRQALEVVINGKMGPFRVTTTHLEYHSPDQRLAQVSRLMELQNECVSDNVSVNTPQILGPYAKIARPDTSIVCGDFNSLPGDEVYETIVNGNSQTKGYLDAWSLAHPDQSHPPTCGVFDTKQWPEGPHCRDYFFLTKDLKSAVQTVEVDLKTRASDHQPILLTLNC